MRALTILVLVLVATLAVAAPAPPTKVHYLQRNEIVGHWDVRWGSVNCLAEFKKNGNYYCSWASGVAVGGWYVKDRVLYIEEYLLNNNGSLGSKSTWTMSLQRSGKCLKGSHTPSPLTVSTILMFRR